MKLFVTDIFTQTTKKYNVRQNEDFRIPVGSVSIFYLDLKTWETVPLKKLMQFSRQFKKGNQKVPENCPCKFRKQYISDAGFLPR